MSLLCPECRQPPASPDDLVCATHGLFRCATEVLDRLDSCPLLGQILDAKYALVDVVGGGGQGAVYLALQQPLGRRVAVKVLQGAAFAEKTGRDRFEREAQALARLTSAHTVRLIDYGVTRIGPVGLRNLPYMVMELLVGEDLEQRLRRGPVPLDELEGLLEGIVDSLTEAHAQGIVHRDLKPSNILLTRTHDGRPQPKVIDFGIARLDSVSRSQSGFISGTPAYMSPEQARGHSELGPAVDQYALGVMCFEMVTGRMPFVAAGPMAMLTQHCSAPVPPLAPDGDAHGLEALEGVIHRAMAKDPASRYESMTAFHRALSAALVEAQRRPKARSTLKPAPPPGGGRRPSEPPGLHRLCGGVRGRHGHDCRRGPPTLRSRRALCGQGGAHG